MVCQVKGKCWGIGNGVIYTGTWSIQAPDSCRAETAFTQVGGQTIQVVQAFQKDKGWIQFDDKTEDFNKE